MAECRLAGAEVHIWSALDSSTSERLALISCHAKWCVQHP